MYIIGAGVPLHIIRDVIEECNRGLSYGGRVDVVYRGKYNHLTIIVPINITYEDNCYSIELREPIRYV